MHPVLLWLVEEICSITVFGGGDVLVAGVSAINGIFIDIDVDLLKHGQVHR